MHQIDQPTPLSYYEAFLSNSYYAIYNVVPSRRPPCTYDIQGIKPDLQTHSTIVILNLINADISSINIHSQNIIWIYIAQTLDYHPFYLLLEATI